MKSAIILATLVLPLSAAEVFEANLGRESELPKGKEADGIRGDFVLRSDSVEALVSHNAHNRRANMSTFYGPDGVSPGCLYDLTLRGSDNDQLICYGPNGHGPVSYVRIVDGKAAVESVTTAAKNNGIYKRHIYEVKDGDSGIWITTTLRNETDKPDSVSTRDDFQRFNDYGVTDGIRWASVVDPAQKAGYALAVVKVDGSKIADDKVALPPGKEVTIQRFMAVGTSALQAWGLAMEKTGKPVASVAGALLDKDGKPVSAGRLTVKIGKHDVWAYPDAAGKLNLKLPPGEYDALAQDTGRADFPLKIKAPGVISAVMTPAATVKFKITDAKGNDLPCKVMFQGTNGTPNPDLGPVMRAHGCKDQYHSETGSFTVALPPGSYKVRVVRGLEYSALEKDVVVAPGAPVSIVGSLKRVVDTTGWISADFHNHSTQSGDNICGTDDRIINIAAENIEFAPTTEHNRLYDWEPHIKKLNLTPWIKTVRGMELTGSRQHFNAFPFTPDPLLQDGGAPEWNDDPRIAAITLRRHQGENATRWIQFNHPDLSNMFIDRDRDGMADGGFVGVGSMIDGMETQNGNATEILADSPVVISRAQGSLAAKVSHVREFIWLQLLNQGHRLVAVAVADAHAVHGNGVAGWLTYLPSKTDNPPDINWDEISPRAKRGEIILTNGPVLSVTCPDGQHAGQDVRANGGIDLKVKVQCTDWVKIDRIQVLVNGRKEPSLNFTRTTHPKLFADGVVQFDQNIHVPLQTDAHLIVVASGENGDLSGGYGNSGQGKMRPCAYNNPIYVDADGNGFKANGDNLGHDLPVGGLTADKVRAMQATKTN